MSKHTREYKRAYYAANREKILARRKEWRKRNLAKCRAAESAWVAAHPDKVRAKQKRYRDAHRLERRAKNAAQMRAKRAADPEKAREMYRQYNQRLKARLAADPVFSARWHAAHAARVRKYNAKTLQVSARFYALSRMYQRKSYAKKVVLAGKPYRPSYSRRIPDWYIKGERIIDYRSPFLPGNITPAQAAYARELAIERKNQRERA